MPDLLVGDDAERGAGRDSKDDQHSLPPDKTKAAHLRVDGLLGRDGLVSMERPAPFRDLRVRGSLEERSHSGRGGRPP